jgi:glycine oxidase
MLSSPTRAEIIVIGAGALGLATAAELKRRGKQPLVLDAQTGLNASQIAAGMLAPAFEAALEESGPDRAAIYRLARDLWPELAERIGLKLDRKGADWIGPREPLMGRMAELGFAVTPTADGFSTNEDWLLDPDEAGPRLLAAAGAAFRAAQVEAIEGSAAGVEVHAVGARFTAEAVVIAAGWAAAKLRAPGLGSVLGMVRPIKGHILKLAGPGTRDISRVTRGPGVYLAPRPDGLMVGASMQPNRSDLTVEPVVVETLRKAAVDLAPALAEARVAQARCGVRGTVPDGLPLAGAVKAPGVHLALAPRRNGWLLAPLVARVVAASIMGGDDPARGLFPPGRFSR